MKSQSIQILLSSLTLIGIGGIAASIAAGPGPQGGGQIITFNAGEVARAADVNQNFTTLETRIADVAATVNAGVEGSQHLDLAMGAITIDSMDAFELSKLTISQTGDFDVALTAHLVIEKFAGTLGGYELDIRRESLSGPVVGQALWRPKFTGTGGMHSATVAFTGFDSAVTGPATYFLVATKAEADTLDATVSPRGLIATWSR